VSRPRERRETQRAHQPHSTSFTFSIFPTRFWIFYRFYHDGDVLLYGHAPHFEHDDHSDGHEEGKEGGGHH